MLFYAPRRYAQAGVVSADELPEAGEWITIVGRITRADLIRMKRRNGQFLKVLVDDDTRVYEASFFNPRYIKNKLQPGARVMTAGKVGLYQGRVQLAHPEWAVLPDGTDPDVAAVGNSMMSELYAVEQEAREAAGDDASLDDAFDRAILPIYPATKDVQTWVIWRAIRQVLARLDAAGREAVVDALTHQQRQQRGLLTTDEAWHAMHVPDDMAQIDAARQSLQRAIALKPQEGQLHVNLAHLELLAGNFADGWREYEWRFSCQQSAPLPGLSAPRWQGEPINGKVLLLWPEQGHGDTLQFCRYAQLLATRGARVWLVCVPALWPLPTTRIHVSPCGSKPIAPSCAPTSSLIRRPVA